MRLIFLICSLVIILAACDAAGDTPEAITLQYLQARVDSDAAALGEYTCAEQEAQIPMQVASFQGRNARLENVSCSFDDDTTVACDGQIIATYQGEENEFAVGNYAVVQEDGEWKVCGETE